MRKILIIGSQGQVGWELRRALSTLGQVIAHSRDSFDMASPEVVRSMMRGIRPQVVVNAAAYTAVDKAEGDQERCMRINAEAPEILAQEAQKLGALLIHYS